MSCKKECSGSSQKDVLNLNKLTVRECLNTSYINNCSKSVNIAGVNIGEDPQILKTKVIIGDRQDLCSEDPYIALTNTNGEIGEWAILDLNDSILAGTAVDNCLYLGSNNRFAGMTYTSILGVSGLSDLTRWEYWNGSSWDKICIMVNNSFTQYANTPFERSMSSRENLRFEDVSQKWYKKELNGIYKFWIRMCVISPLPSIPTIKDVSFFTSFKSISNQGVNQYFGTATLQRELIFHRKLLDQVNNKPPTLRDLLLTSTFFIDSSLNSFVHTDEESVGGIFRIPPKIDTSAKMIINLSWYPFTTVPNIRVGYIQWNIEYAPLKAGSIINGNVPSTTVSKRVLVDKPNNDNYLYLTQFEICIEKLLPNEMIAIRLFRDEPNSGIIDLFESNINLVDIVGVVRIFK